MYNIYTYIQCELCACLCIRCTKSHIYIITYTRIACQSCIYSISFSIYAYSLISTTKYMWHGELHSSGSMFLKKKKLLNCQIANHIFFLWDQYFVCAPSEGENRSLAWSVYAAAAAINTHAECEV